MSSRALRRGLESLPRGRRRRSSEPGERVARARGSIRSLAFSAVFRDGVLARAAVDRERSAHSAGPLLQRPIQ